MFIYLFASNMEVKLISPYNGHQNMPTTTYNTFSGQAILRFSPIGIEAVTMLVKLFVKSHGNGSARGVPTDCWQTIWNYLIGPDSGQTNSFKHLLHLGMTSKELYDTVFLKCYIAIVQTRLGKMDESTLFDCTRRLNELCRSIHGREAHEVFKGMVSNNLAEAHLILGNGRYGVYYAPTRIDGNDGHMIYYRGGALTQRDYLYLADVYDYNLDSRCRMKCCGCMWVIESWCPFFAPFCCVCPCFCVKDIFDSRKQNDYCSMCFGTVRVYDVYDVYDVS